MYPLAKAVEYDGLCKLVKLVKPSIVQIYIYGHE